MTDLLTATQDAIYAALDVPAVTGLARLFQHVPEESPPVQPPYHVIAGMTAEPMGGKDGGLDRVTVEVLTYTREPRRAALFERMATVRAALDGTRLPSEDAILSAPEFVSAEDGILDDGVTYEGVQRFALWAQPGPPNLHPDPSFEDAGSWSGTGTIVNAGGMIVAAGANTTSDRAELNDSVGKLAQFLAALPDGQYVLEISIAAWASGYPRITLPYTAAGVLFTSVNGPGRYSAPFTVNRGGGNPVHWIRNGGGVGSWSLDKIRVTAT